jgi:hypothetical protein
MQRVPQRDRQLIAVRLQDIPDHAEIRNTAFVKPRQKFRIVGAGQGHTSEAGVELLTALVVVLGLAFHDMVKSGELKAPIVIGRDHLDTGSVASPNRETEAMADGSDAVSDWPLLNLLLNTAGIFQLTPFVETSLDQWQETLDVNLTGAFIWSKAVWPHIAGGQIINVSSVAGYLGIYGYSAGFLRRFPTLQASPLEQIESLEQLRVLWHGDRIAVRVPHFLVVPMILDRTDLVVTVPSRVAAIFARLGNFKVLKLPLIATFAGVVALGILMVGYVFNLVL